MKNKFSLISLLTAMITLSLSACSTPESSSSGESSSDSSSSSEESASSSTMEEIPIPDTSSSEDDGSDGLFIDLLRSYISEGTSFLDACEPLVSFRRNGVTTTLRSGYTWTIQEAEGSAAYTASEPLEKGLYIATVSYTYNSVRYTKWTYFSVRGYSASSSGGYEVIDPQYTLDSNPELGVFGIQGVEGACPSVSSPKMLVIPLTFENLESFSESEIANITTAYTSDTLSNRGFFSLQDYYYRSSYGKLNIDVEIHDEFVMPCTTDEFEDYGTSDAFVYLFEALLEEMDNNGEDFADYDSNGDGYIDGVHLIYKTDKTLDGSFWWHYTTGFSSDDAVSIPSGQSVHPSTFFFSAYSYLMNGYYGSNTPDTHTIIHETGHMLGASDYYSYDYDEGPAGGVDMMDLDVGDHSPYTKMLLGWSEPMVIDGSEDHFEVTLEPYESSGDFILLRNTDEGWNGTPFDEYLTLSYYAPTGINAPDAGGYARWTGRGEGGAYDEYGLQVFHVDSRGLVYRDNSTNRYNYWDPEMHTAEQMFRIAASNTASRSYQLNSSGVASSSNYRLIEALTSDGIDRFNSSNYYNYFGNDKNLFGLGDTYGGSSYGNYKMQNYFANANAFNDGTILDYSFRITAMDESSITLRFDHIGG